MVFVFNLFALLQLLIMAGCFAVFYYSISWFYDLDANPGGKYIGLLFLALVAVYTEVKGIRGRLFYLPVWIICLIVAIVAFYESKTFSIEHGEFKVIKAGALETILFYLTFCAIVFFYFKWMRREIDKRWAQAKLNLEQMKSIVQNSETVDQKVFWALSSAVFYKPGLFFLYQYPLWKMVFGEAMTREAFVKHYADFLELINPDFLVHADHKRWVEEFRGSLNKAQLNGVYAHQSFSLSNLQKVIDERLDFVGRT